MLIGHSAGTAAAIFASNRTAMKTIQDIDADTLTAALQREGQVLHPPSPAPAGGGGAPGWGCELIGSHKSKTCVGVGPFEPGKPNLHAASNCSGACPSLAPNAWLALSDLWREVRSKAVGTLVATEATFLKKSVAQSNTLPASMVMAVPKDFRCMLPDSRKYQQYWLCSTIDDGPSDAVIIKTDDTMAVAAPATPSPEQLAYMDSGLTMFIHLSPNTFMNSTEHNCDPKDERQNP